MLDFLDYFRESVILKVNGLEEEAARGSSVPSGTSLLGLIKHLSVAAYRNAIRINNDIVISARTWTASVRGRRRPLSHCRFGGFWYTWLRRPLGMQATPTSFESRSMDKLADDPASGVALERRLRV